METLFVVFLVSSILGAYLLAAWLDQKHGWQLTHWLNGKAVNPFASQRTSSLLTEKDQTIKELKARVEVLEKIVTEPAYELNKKINAL